MLIRESQAFASRGKSGLKIHLNGSLAFFTFLRNKILFSCRYFSHGAVTVGMTDSSTFSPTSYLVILKCRSYFYSNVSFAKSQFIFAVQFKRVDELSSVLFSLENSDE